ncbi:MAG: MmgE/PrpD family protein [Nitrososphaerales archaeon]
MQQLSKIYSEYVTSVSFENLPQEVVRRAKLHILDHIGVAAAASQAPLYKAISKYLGSLKGEGEATIIGENYMTTSLNAALLNGLKGHSLELEDGHRLSACHIGAVVIPAALAIAEIMDIDGKTLITGIVCGYEVMARIGMAMHPWHTKKGFHPTGTIGPFGAAVAVGKIINLNEERMASALGIAGTQSSGLLEVVERGQDVKPLHAGKAAQSGLLAALLAKDGIKGPDTIFEGDKGFLKAMGENVKFELFTLNLGKDYEINKTYFKFYSCCRHMHALIDASLELYNKVKLLDLNSIDEVIVRTNSVAASLTGKIQEPKTTGEAKFSAPYAVALSLVKGSFGVDELIYDEFTPNQEALKLAKKVKVLVDPEIDKDYPRSRRSIIEVKLKNGKILQAVVNYPKGEPENFDEQSVINKFLTLASKIFKVERAKEIMESTFKLEEFYKISDFTKLLRI